MLLGELNLDIALAESMVPGMDLLSVPAADCARAGCEDSATHTRIMDDGSEELLCCNHFEDEANAPVLEILEEE